MLELLEQKVSIGSNKIEQEEWAKADSQELSGPNHSLLYPNSLESFQKLLEGLRQDVTSWGL